MPTSDLDHFDPAALTSEERCRRMVQIDRRLEELSNYRTLSNEKRSELSALTEEFEKLDRAEKEHIVAGVRDKVLQQRRNGTVIVDQPIHSDGTPFDHDPGRRFGDSLRDQARRTIDDAHRSKQLPDHAAAAAEKLVTDGSTFDQGVAARWAVVTGAPAYRTAFAALLADPDRGHLTWTEQEAEAYRNVAAYQSEVRAMSLSDSAGGYLVPMSLDPAIMLTSDGSINPLRRISRVVQTATDAWRGVTSAGATAEWKAEAAEVADATPTLGSPTIPVWFGDSYVPFSFEIGQDATAFMSELQKVLVDSADQLQASAYTTGSGTGQPTGFVTALDGTSSEVAPTVAEQFGAADAFKLQNALPPRFQANAQWCAALPTINSLAQMETTNGALKFPEIGSGQLLRRPLNELSNMDGTYNAAQSADNFLMCYGDWQQFVIVDRIGTTLELIPHLFGENGRPTASRGALLWFRTGSDVVVDNAFRILNVATTA